MNLPKAIEIVNDLLYDSPTLPPGDTRTAVILSHEALKRIINDRDLYSYMEPQTLPGETEN
ncbi:hypothetical protein ES708_21757 [subsurface metagenome]